MGLEISAQVSELFYAAGLGIGLGVLYDVFRLVRIVFGRRAGVTATADLLFCLFAVAALFFFNLTFLSGIIRWYVLCGTAGGAVLYFLSVSRLIIYAGGMLVEKAAFLAGRIKQKNKKFGENKK